MGLFQTLNERVLGRGTWPPRETRELWELIEFWSALRRNDEARIKLQANVPWHRRYLLSPVPRMVSRASANLLLGEPAQIKPANEGDDENLERIRTENGLDAEAHRGAMIASSEGEVWGRLIFRPDLLDVPIIEFESRRTVLPHFAGRFVVGATFVSEWPEGRNDVLRLFETYEAGAVTATLYRGTTTALGTPIPLDSYDETKGVQEYVATGFDYPLVAFIPNSIDADPSRGFSDYAGCEERFLALNEAATVGQENLRLAGKKRALLDARYTRNGRLVPGDDIFVRTEDMATAGESSKPLQMLEYTFEADAVIRWVDHLVDTTLQFTGTAPQLVGRSVDGGAVSGTALKLKMLHSLMEASGKGGYLDRGLRRLLRAAAIVDSRPTTQGGFGRTWADADADPSIVRGDGLPRDDLEAAQWLVLAANAEAISLEEKVRWLHPDWTDEQVADEVKAIEDSKPAPPAIPTPRPPIEPIVPVE